MMPFEDDADVELEENNPWQKNRRLKHTPQKRRNISSEKDILLGGGVRRARRRESVEQRENHADDLLPEASPIFPIPNLG